MRLAASIASGRGKVLPIFGARTAASAPTLPLPLRSRNRREGAEAGERPHQRAAADAGCAPRRHEGAHVGGRELGKVRQRGRAAEMLGEKLEELQHVAPVGLDRLRRHAPLGAKMLEPVFDLGRDLGRHKVRANPYFSRSAQLRGVSAGFPLARDISRHYRHPLPFLSRPESAGKLAPWPSASSMFWSRSRSTGPIPTGCRTSSSSLRATSSACRSAPARRPRWCGRKIQNPNPARQPAQGCRGKTRAAAAQAGVAQLRRLGGELHREFARHGAAHVPAHGRASRRRARTGRRAARRAAAAAHDARRASACWRCLPTAWCAAKATRRAKRASARA